MEEEREEAAAGRRFLERAGLVLPYRRMEWLESGTLALGQMQAITYRTKQNEIDDEI